MPRRLTEHPAAGVTAVAVATAFFSLGFPIVKGVDLPGASIAFWRLLLGASCLAACAAVLRVPWPRQWRPVVWAGLLFAAHQIVFIEATKLTSIAIVTLFAALQPLLVALVSRRVVGERAPRALIGCALLALAGVALVVLANLGDASRSLEGDLLSALNALLFTAYFLFAKNARLAGAPTLTFTAAFLGVALVAVVPFVLVGGRLAPAGLGDAGMLVVLALLPGNGHLLVNWAHSRVSATLASLVLAGIPVLGAVWGRVFFGEPLGWPHLVGMGLVIAAIVGARRVEQRHARAAAQARRATLVADA